MFSGIVEAVGKVARVDDFVVTIQTPGKWKLREGQSISVEGVCSTVQAIGRKTFSVVYMLETLRRTTLGGLRAGSRVNLERSLRLNSLIGGHLVQGHVDTKAEIRKVTPDGDASIYEFALPRKYSRYVVEKGSVALDGISLTVASLRGGRFTVSLLAYTLSHTTLGGKRPGDRVNLEIDMVAKYVEKLIR